jgi:hypothetical protein
VFRLWSISHSRRLLRSNVLEWCFEVSTYKGCEPAVGSPDRQSWYLHFIRVKEPEPKGLVPLQQHGEKSSEPASEGFHFTIRTRMPLNLVGI